MVKVFGLNMYQSDVERLFYWLAAEAFLALCILLALLYWPIPIRQAISTTFFVFILSVCLTTYVFTWTNLRKHIVFVTLTSLAVVGLCEIAKPNPTTIKCEQQLKKTSALALQNQVVPN